MVIGAGSAGCVLANRLSADPSRRVLLLEAGGGDRHVTLRMPAALSMPMNDPRFDWQLFSEPEPHLGSRRLHCPRGRVIGGSSSINGMVYVRGNPHDYERWMALGADGWGYADVLPYFKRMEAATADRFHRYRGADGPLAIRRGTVDNPLHAAFLQATREAGYLTSDDLNGFRQEGFGRFEATIENGSRCSAARAYLRPAATRHNLEIRLRARVEGITIEAGRAVGVTVRTANGSERIAAEREVVLSAGAIHSPQILMLSGIGPAEELARLGIDTVHPLSGIGKNLMDHLEVYVQQACREPITLNRWLNPAGKALIGTQWLATRSGLGATNHFETGGFVRSSAGVEWPDVQLHFLAAAVAYDGSKKAAQHGFQVHVGPMLSPSRGEITLRSANPADDPVIRFGYMAHAEDWLTFRRAIRLAREIFAQPAFDAFRANELSPGPEAQADDALDAFVRDHAQSAYHPCGTCRMGKDHAAVVDEQCRVHGLDRLRVVDASVFPHIPNGNLNAPTIMVAEKAADAILGTQLEPEPAPFHTDPHWRRRQRPRAA